VAQVVDGDDREEPRNASRSVRDVLASPKCLVAEVVSWGTIPSIALGATDFSRFLVIVSTPISESLKVTEGRPTPA
jgi:hypothetical protein